MKLLYANTELRCHQTTEFNRASTANRTDLSDDRLNEVFARRIASPRQRRDLLCRWYHRTAEKRL